MINEELNTAVVKFLGFGSATAPQRDGSVLLALFGQEKGAAMARNVAQLLDELGRIQVDWTKYTLESAGEMAKIRMSEAHPELSATALQALEWKFTYDWR